MPSNQAGSKDNISKAWEGINKVDIECLLWSEGHRLQKALSAKDLTEILMMET